MLLNSLNVGNGILKIKYSLPLLNKRSLCVNPVKCRSQSRFGRNYCSIMSFAYFSELCVVYFEFSSWECGDKQISGIVSLMLWLSKLCMNMSGFDRAYMPFLQWPIFSLQPHCGSSRIRLRLSAICPYWLISGHDILIFAIL